MYWANDGTDSVGRATLDGTDPNPSFIATTGNVGPRGVAVDGAHAYWAHNIEAAPDAIGRADLDGNPASVNQTFITGANNPVGVAVDATHIYWANLGDGKIGRAELDGDPVQQDFVTGAGTPCGVAVDPTYLYWADATFPAPDTIGRAALDGSSSPDPNFITNASNPCGVAVNATHIYWANSGTDTIGRADIDGTDPNQSFIATGDFPSGVAVDGAHIYWANRGTSGTPGTTIGRADLDGTPASVNNSFITGANLPNGIAVDALSPPQTPEPPLPPPDPGSTTPSNDISFGEVDKNKKKGTATLGVIVPGSGQLSLAETEKVKGASARATAAGEVTLPVRPKGPAKEKVREDGKAKVTADVTFTPDGGTANTESTKVKLVRRP